MARIPHPFPKAKGFKMGLPLPKGEGEGIQSVHAQIQQCPNFFLVLSLSLLTLLLLAL
jgi:hypothetical protein